MTILYYFLLSSRLTHNGVRFLIKTILIYVFFHTASYAGQIEHCQILHHERRNNITFFQIGKVWSGVGTGLGRAIGIDGSFYVAFYDENRFIRVAHFDPATSRLCYTVFNSQFGGWDAHNSLELAISQDGVLHLSGNMHGTELFYARSSDAELQHFVVQKMIGTDESRTTYPRFLRDASGRLIFLYRSGGSGDGVWIANRWENGEWIRLGAPFAGRDIGGPSSAYPIFSQTTDGLTHVVIVWRRTPDVSTNYAVTYAKTRDFDSWLRADGTPITAPLSVDNMDIVDRPGTEAGLVNNPRITQDAAGSPIIFYTKYGHGKRNFLYLSFFDGNNWQIRELLGLQDRVNVRGVGAISFLPSIIIGPGTSDQRYRNLRFKSRGSLRDITVDLSTFIISPTMYHPRTSTWKFTKDELKGLSQASQRSIIMSNADSSQNVALGSLYWYAQGANGDRPRKCNKDAPLACLPPPSPLIWTPAYR